MIVKAWRRLVLPSVGVPCGAQDMCKLAQANEGVEPGLLFSMSRPTLVPVGCSLSTIVEGVHVQP